MKINNQTFARVEADINTIIDHLEIDRDTLTDHDVNQVWFIAWCNRTYNDDHKAIIKDANGNRLLSFIDRDNYDLYPCDTNDTTIYTAWRKIIANWHK